MNASQKVRPVSVAACGLLAAVSLASPAAKQASKGGGWLDAGVANWNQPASEVPKAPPSNAASRERCKELLRLPSGVHDRALIAQGWWLYGPLQRFGRSVVVTGATDADSECRPLGSQVFVFFEKRFAGTLSPVVMNARTDGSQSRFSLVRERGITVDYARYAKGDVPCCPSGSATVSFEIEDKPAGPVVAPGKPRSAPASH